MVVVVVVVVEVVVVVVEVAVVVVEVCERRNLEKTSHFSKRTKKRACDQKIKIYEKHI